MMIKTFFIFFVFISTLSFAGTPDWWFYNLENDIGFPSTNTTYYVSSEDPLSSDLNEGTEQSPFKTILKATKMVSPGDIVILQQGVYQEPLIPIKNGNKKAPILFKKNPSASFVRLDLTDIVTTNSLKTAIFLDKLSYVIIQGIDVKGCDVAVHVKNSSNCMISEIYSGSLAQKMISVENSESIVFSKIRSGYDIKNQLISIIGKTKNCLFIEIEQNVPYDPENNN